MTFQCQKKFETIEFFRNGLTLIIMILPLLLMSCSESPEKDNRDSSKSSETKEVVTQTKSKVLLVNSYHKGYFWTDGITKAIAQTFGSVIEKNGAIDNSKSKVTLDITYMDTKRNPSEEYKEKIAISLKERISSWRPDLVITTDDNAAKYLIVPYFYKSDLPFVFCGVNWDASTYGFPASNVTGMIEVQLIDQIIKSLRKYAKGDRIAFIKGDDFSARKEAEFFEKRFGIKLINRFVKNFSEWQRQYTLLQDEADIIFIGNPASIPDWDDNKALIFIHEITKVPTGSWDESMKKFNMVTFATVPKEQGQWAANTALNILNGISPSDIPMVTNKVARVYLNMTLAKKLGIIFPVELIDRAILLEAEY